VSFWGFAAGEFDEVSFGVAVEFAFVFAVGLAVMNRREPSFGLGLADVVNCLGMATDVLTDHFISELVVSLQKNSCTSVVLCSPFTGGSEPFERFAVFVAEVNDIFLRPHSVHYAPRGNNVIPSSLKLQSASRLLKFRLTVFLSTGYKDLISAVIGMQAVTDPDVVWLTPDKPKNISVGRQRIADHLEERGFDVTMRGTSWRTVARSLRERNRYDVVIGTTRAGAISGVLLKLLGTPLIIDHIDPIRQFAENNPRWLAVIVRLLENVSFLAADHVLYVYEEERPRVKRYASSYSETDLGVEFDRFADPNPEIVESARNRLEALDLAEQVVIYVGGLEPIYHIEELLAAMEHLPDWSLIVVGTGSLQDTVSATAAQRSNVHYLGTVPHETVPGYLQAADVGVSLVDDPHTLKLLEYGAAGF
jgi:glycosyltransferase involved in cell wall biosynthesis